VIELGDMAILAPPPAKLAKALAVVAKYLHPEFARQPWIANADKSKESCVLSSLAVRDFLRAIGYRDARVRPVAFIVRAERNGAEIHSAGIGVPEGGDDRHEHGQWNGHLVATIPSLGWLIDTTLYQIKRPAWPDLPGMVALPVGRKAPAAVYGLREITGASMVEPADNYRCDLLWLANPRNTRYREGGDAEPYRREPVVAAMVKQFLP
jgi:hypothetical protein